MKFAAFYVAAALLSILPSAMAQTVVNNNITINNDGSNGRWGNRDQGTAVYWRNNTLHREAWMRTDRTQYSAGRGVQISLSLTNLLQNSTTIRSGNLGEYQITITDVRTNRVIWSRDRSRYRGSITQLTSGGTANWTEFWDQRDNSGNAVPGGAYRIDAKVFDLPLSSQIFLMDQGNSRPDPAPGLVTPDPVDGPAPGGGRPGPPPRPLVTDFSGITGILSVDKAAVKRGDTVRMTYTVVNTRQTPVDLVFGSSQLFDVTARLKDNAPLGAPSRAIWRMSDGMAYSQVIQRVSLAPGERHAFSALWQIGSTVPEGQIDLQATLKPAGAGMSQVGLGRALITVN